MNPWGCSLTTAVASKPPYQTLLAYVSNIHSSFLQHLFLIIQYPSDIAIVSVMGTLSHYAVKTLICFVSLEHKMKDCLQIECRLHPVIHSKP